MSYFRLNDDRVGTGNGKNDPMPDSMSSAIAHEMAVNRPYSDQRASPDYSVRREKALVHCGR
jgi:hypothetical protein